MDDHRPTRQARHQPRVRLGACLALLAAASIAGCSGASGAASAGGKGSPGAPTNSAPTNSAPAKTGSPIPAPSQRKPGTPPARDAVPGIGPKTMKQIPEGTRQVVVSSTEKKKGTRAHTTFYRLTSDGSWTAVKDWPGHNGQNGWKEKRSVGDKTSPIGVFGLTDAGGYLKNPGTKLPYDRDASYRGAASATYGSAYSKVFNYLIAINFNRVAGSKPTDGRHPHGAARGGKIWLHVDHDSATRGCITINQSGVKFLLTHLDPKAKPVIVTGPTSAISR